VDGVQRLEIKNTSKDRGMRDDHHRTGKNQGATEQDGPHRGEGKKAREGRGEVPCPTLEET